MKDRSPSSRGGADGRAARRVIGTIDSLARSRDSRARVAEFAVTDPEVETVLHGDLEVPLDDVLQTRGLGRDHGRLRQQIARLERAGGQDRRGQVAGGVTGRGTRLGADEDGTIGTVQPRQMSAARSRP